MSGAGAVVWTCTCLLVMSGTASIGSRISDHAPNSAAPRLSHITSQRRWIAKARMDLIMVTFAHRMGIGAPHPCHSGMQQTA
jgi:hypothetical protein